MPASDIHSQPFGPNDSLPGHCPQCNASALVVRAGWVCCAGCGCKLYPAEGR